MHSSARILSARGVRARLLRAAWARGVPAPSMDAAGDVPVAGGISTGACLVGASLCVVGAGLVAGLTMGFVGTDPRTLTLLSGARLDDCESAEEARAMALAQRHAAIVLPVVRRKHWLLSSLLLANALFLETIPVFLDRILNPALAVLVSLTLVLVFGEIVPSAFFTGPSRLAMAAKFAPLVRALMTVTSPVSYPLSRVLDALFGREGHEDEGFRRTDLRAIVRGLGPRSAEDPASDELVTNGLSTSLATASISGVARGDAGADERLSADEAEIIIAVLGLRRLTCGACCVPLAETFTASTDDVMDADFLARLLAAGFSRGPCHRGRDKRQICGVLLTKLLITISPADKRTVGSLPLRVPLVLSSGMPLLDALNAMQQAKSHLALVTDRPATLRSTLREGVPVPPDVLLLGVLTLEDIFERLIAEEIDDETEPRANGDLVRRVHALSRRPGLWTAELRRAHHARNVKLMWQAAAAGALVSARRDPAARGMAMPHALVSPLADSLLRMPPGTGLLHAPPQTPPLLPAQPQAQQPLLPRPPTLPRKTRAPAKSFPSSAGGSGGTLGT